MHITWPVYIDAYITNIFILKKYFSICIQRSGKPDTKILIVYSLSGVWVPDWFPSFHSEKCQIYRKAAERTHQTFFIFHLILSCYHFATSAVCMAKPHENCISSSLLRIRDIITLYSSILCTQMYLLRRVFSYITTIRWSHSRTDYWYNTII